MRKGWTTIAIVGGLALLAFLLVLGFFTSLKNTEQVVVAAQALPAGARLTAGSVTLKEIHSSAILPNALHDPAEAVDQVLQVPRLPGEQITLDMLGTRAVSAIAATLPEGHRAMAVKVDRVTGLVGALTPGSTVTLIGILEPPQGTSYSVSTTGGGEEEVTVPSPTAMVVLRGVRVLLVPQEFRYEEILPGEEGGWSPVRTTVSAQRESAVVVDVPLEPPVEIFGLEVSPAVAVALVNAYGSFHLAMEPMAETTEAITSTVPVLDLYSLYSAALEWEQEQEEEEEWK